MSFCSGRYIWSGPDPGTSIQPGLYERGLLFYDYRFPAVLPADLSNQPGAFQSVLAWSSDHNGACRNRFFRGDTAHYFGFSREIGLSRGKYEVLGKAFLIEAYTKHGSSGQRGRWSIGRAYRCPKPTMASASQLNPCNHRWRCTRREAPMASKKNRAMEAKPMRERNRSLLVSMSRQDFYSVAGSGVEARPRILLRL